MENYFVLMGDIKDSRKCAAKILSSNLKKILEKANDEFKVNILSRLEIKVGDDFQVVMKDIHSILEMLIFLDISFIRENIECRFAIGYGRIYGKISLSEHSEMISNCLTNTNEILNQKEKKYNFYVENDIDKTILLNTIGLLIENVFSDFTDKQKEFLYLKIVKRMNLKEIQNKMNIKERAIYYYIERTNYSYIMSVFEKISLSFNEDKKEKFKKYFKDMRINEEN